MIKNACMYVIDGILASSLSMQISPLSHHLLARGLLLQSQSSESLCLYLITINTGRVVTRRQCRDQVEAYVDVPMLTNWEMKQKIYLFSYWFYFRMKSTNFVSICYGITMVFFLYYLLAVVQYKPIKKIQITITTVAHSPPVSQ